jgi:transketolase
MGVQLSLDAKEMLKKEGVLASVINIHTLKPLDVEFISQIAKETGAVVIVEDHNVIGGLGDSVASIVSDNYPVPINMVGCPDKFLESASPEYLYKLDGLTKEGIVEANKNFIARK